MIKNVKRACSFILIAFVLAFSAEGVSWFFLPAPHIQKLPMIEHYADPFCGYRLKPEQSGYILDQLSTTNSWGYRDRKWTVEKPEGTVRVAVIGASLAYGHGVKDEQVFPRQTENILNQKSGARYEVMNFGVPGYDSGHMLCVLERDVLQFKPDIVLMTFSLIDLFYIPDYGFYPELFRLEKENFSLLKWNFLNFCRHSRLAQYLWDLLKYRFGFREPDEVGMAVESYALKGSLPGSGPKTDGWQFLEKNLNRYAELSREHNFKPLLAVIPSYQEIFDRGRKSKYAAYLAGKCRGLGIEPLLFLPVLLESGLKPSDYLIAYDYHFKPEGHKLAAEFIAGEVLKQTPFINEAGKTS